MTHQDRDRIRQAISDAKRQRLAGLKQLPRPDPAIRRASYAAYYQRNRERILARRAAKRAA